MLRVVVADDHPLVRKGIERILSDDSRIQMLGTASDCSEAIVRAREFRPDVLIVDLHMFLSPELSGGNIGATLKLYATKILGISFAIDDDARCLATSIGASELLDKTKLAEELIPALMRLAAGKTYFPQQHTHQSRDRSEL